MRSNCFNYFKAHKGALLLVACVLVVIYLLPYVVLWERGRYMTWDNLDSVHVLFKLLHESGALFASNSTVVPQIMGGLPRGSLPSELSVTTWLYALLGPLQSYIAERFVVSFVALFGMFWLLSAYVVPGRQNILVSAGVAVCFAVLPFWPYGGLSVAGLPLVLWAYLRIRSGQLNWYHWLILLVFPFYSSLVLSGVFLLTVLCAIVLRDCLLRKQPPWNQLGAIFVLGAGFCVTHYRLFVSFLGDNDYVSHRYEFEPVNGFYGLHRAIHSACLLFINGQPHAESLHLVIVIPTICAGIVIACTKRFPKAPLLAGLGGLMAISLLYGASDASFFRPFDRGVRSIIPIQYDRFYILGPVIWYSLFAISLVYITRLCKKFMWLPLAILAAQFVVCYSHNELIKGELEWRRGSPTAPTYSEFYAVEQFTEIKQFIGRRVESYRVGVVGMHPAIALYNGFHTVDGYAYDYPLPYKQRFRRVIEGELAKNEYLARYFDRWGSRAYLFTSAKTGAMSTKWSEISKNTVEDISFDWNALNELGADYIISASPLETREAGALSLSAVFTNSESAWDVYLYAINSRIF
jgi:hypothetical protein